MRDRRAALELLGLEMGEPVTHDRLRRAYLRRLRAHPPERDPEGFQRLREAFEELEPWARMCDYLQAAAAERAQSGVPAHGSDEPDRSEASPHGADDASEPAPAIVVHLDNGERVELRTALRQRRIPWVWDPSRPAEGRDTAAEESTARPGATANLEPPGDAAGRGSAQPGAGGASKAGEAGAVRAADRRSPGAYEPPDEPPHRASGQPVGARPDQPPKTLRDVTDEILARLQTGRADAALDLADRWRRSTLDDHREVSPQEAQRWALTRELLDVAPAIPDSLRRAIARGIATDNLAIACSAAETYQALHPAQANDVAESLELRATSLHKLLAGLLQSRAGLRGARQQSSGSSRAPIWAAVLIISALVRVAGSCEHASRPDLNHTPTPQWQLDRTPGPPSPMDDTGSQWQIDPRRSLHDQSAPRFDPHRSWIDRMLPRPARDLRSPSPTGEPGSKPPLEVRPEAQPPPSRP